LTDIFVIACFEQHPATDLDDHARRLERRQEHFGLEQSPGRVIPAKQRLHTDGGHGVEIEDRLVEEEELVRPDGRLQIHLELVATAQRGLHLGLEDDEAVATGVLGGVQRDVGVTQEVVSCVTVADGDTDAGRNRDGTARDVLQLERLGQHSQEALGQQFGTGGKRDPLGQDDELVAPEPCDGVRVAQCPSKPGGHRLEELVPVAVTEVVVDVLEAVEIDEEEGHVEVLTA
jgi:hypothetical protein